MLMRTVQVPTLPMLLLSTLMLAWTPGSALGQDNDLEDLIVRPDSPAAEPDRWLSNQRWSELRYGLSLRQPKDAQLMEQMRDGALARWNLPNGARISLTIYRGVHYVRDKQGNTQQKRIHLNTVVTDIIATLEGGGTGVVPITQLEPGSAVRVHNTRSDQWLKVGELLGYANYFAMVPTGSQDPWMFGIGLLQLDDTSMLTLRLECPHDVVPESVCAFESMLHSVQIESPTDATARIKSWVDAGDELLKTITPEQYRAAMRPDRLFRVVEGDRDIGYQRIWQRHQGPDYYAKLKQQLARNNPDAKLQGIDQFEATGNALVIQSHYDAAGIQIDLLHEYIDEDTGISEYWQIKSSLENKNNPRSQMAGTWVETGFRGIANFQNRQVDQIQVIREGTPPRQMTEFLLERERDPKRRLRFPSARADMHPSGEMTSNAWATPSKAYISQVDALLIPALLPADRAQTYAFFAYHVESTAVALRIMRVEPLPGGGKIVHLRPTIDMAEQTLEYDANGELIRWTYHDGRKMLLTTREELNRIWRVRNSR